MDTHHKCSLAGEAIRHDVTKVVALFVITLRLSGHDTRRTKHYTRLYREQGDTAIIYLEGDDLQRTFQELRTSQDPFDIWFRQRAKNILDGLDLTQTSPGSLSKLVFDGPSVEEGEGSYHAREVMERLGMISP